MSDKLVAKATAKYVRMSPSKVRRVLKQLKYLNYQEALMVLEFLPYRSCLPIWQVLQSAAANAQTNLGLKKQNLFIAEAYVDKGPVLKRFRSRAQGRVYSIHKHTCHITIKVQSNEE
jgi:large subunit ribosomal protein L22